MTRPWLLVALVGLMALATVVGVSAAPPTVTSVTATPNSQNQIPFFVQLSRPLTTGEFITFDLGGTSSLPTGVVPDAAHFGCINNQGADYRYNNWDPTSPSYVANPSSGTIVYPIHTLVAVGHTPGDLYTCGCQFVEQAPLPGGAIPFAGYMLITFHSTSIVEPIYFGCVTLIQELTMTSSPAVLSVMINAVPTGSTLIGTQQLTGSLYRVLPIPVPPHNGSPPYPIAPLQATLNSHIVVTFQSTSDLVFLYWLTGLTAYLCPTSSTAPTGCTLIDTAKYTGGPAPTSWPAPQIPFGTTTLSGATHWGYENPNSEVLLETYNNLISFWVTIPADSPCTGSTCSLQVIAVLTVDTASVHAQSSTKPEMKAMAAGASMKTLATTETGGNILLTASADITVTAEDANGLENGTTLTTSSSAPLLLAMLATAVLALMVTRA